jgi:hypothetical protein
MCGPENGLLPPETARLTVRQHYPLSGTRANQSVAAAHGRKLRTASRSDNKEDQARKLSPNACASTAENDPHVGVIIGGVPGRLDPLSARTEAGGTEPIPTAVDLHYA